MDLKIVNSTIKTIVNRYLQGETVPISTWDHGYGFRVHYKDIYVEVCTWGFHITLMAANHKAEVFNILGPLSPTYHRLRKIVKLDNKKQKMKVKQNQYEKEQQLMTIINEKLDLAGQELEKSVFKE